ncbi:MAG: trigger factor [Candidatus Dormibacteraeota bacterium]|nr:trigger factor [Candidatus Dormibacteraeota bacterium]
MAEVKVETEKKPGSQVVLTIEVPEDQVKRSIDVAYSRLAPRVRIAGFRPGKAPRPMIEKELGWPTLRQEALDILLPVAYNAAVAEAKIDPIDNPHVDIQQFDRGQPMKFSATVSVKPEVELRDYEDIRVPRPQTEIGDPDVDEAIERLRTRFAELHEADRPVHDGDFLTVDVHLVKSGAVLVGESQTDAQLEVDAERLLPGLAPGLIGQTVGETRDIALTLPADYPKKDLAGSSVIFRVTVKSIKERVLPPVDDELARQVGRGETLAALREELHGELQDAATHADEQRFENDVLKALDERLSVEVPEAMIDQEIDRRLRELELRLQEQGIKVDRYLEYTKTTPEALRSEQRPAAVQKVRLELALATVADRAGITVPEEEIDAALNTALSEEQLATRRARDLRTADPVRAYFRHQLLMRKTIDYLGTVAAPDSSDTIGPSEAGEAEATAEPASKGQRRQTGKKER